MVSHAFYNHVDNQLIPTYSRLTCPMWHILCSRCLRIAVKKKYEVLMPLIENQSKARSTKPLCCIYMSSFTNENLSSSFASVEYSLWGFICYICKNLLFVFLIVLWNFRLKSLISVPKVQPRFAIAISKKYPTMKSLLSVYMDPSKSVSTLQPLLSLQVSLWQISRALWLKYVL